MSDIQKKKQQNKSTQSPLVDDALIEKSVHFINEKANETLYRGSIEIGEYILKHFFNDDEELAASRNPKKPKSFKALLEHKDLAIPYTTLTIMVRVAAQERFFRKNRIELNGISYSHKAELIRLKNSPGKIELVKQCIEGNLSTRDLNKMVTKTRRSIIADKKDEKNESGFKNLLRMDQLLNRSEKAELITDLDTLKNMRKKTRKDLKKKTALLLEQMSQRVKECRKILKNIDKIEKNQ